MDQEKNVIVFGQTGSGKSYILNVLVGYDPDVDDNIPFEIASTCFSCTKLPQSKTGTLYGKKTSLKIKVLDLPGIFDTTDTQKDQKQGQNQKPESIKYLEQMQQSIKSTFNDKINKVLFCVDINRPWDHQSKNTLMILNKFVKYQSSISVFITKCNMVHKKSISTRIQTWRDIFQGYNMQVFFFGNCQNIDEAFEHNLAKSNQIKLKYWSELSISDKEIIGNCFYYVVPKESGCFSLDMLISMKDGKQQQCGKEMNKLLMTDGSQDNKFLGYVHFDLHSKMQFIQFITLDDQLIECTGNHLIYCRKKSGDQESSSFVQAQYIEEGDYLLIIKMDNNGKLVKIPSKIIEKKIIMKIGFWCPLTSSGSIVVNNFLVSSYTSNLTYFNQKLAHLSMMPLITYRKMFGYSSKFENDQFLSPYTVQSLRKKLRNQK